jgi:hypothetical protein
LIELLEGIMQLGAKVYQGFQVSINLYSTKISDVTIYDRNTKKAGLR